MNSLQNRRIGWSRFWTFLIFAVLGFAGPADAQTTDALSLGANSTVYALAVQPNGKLLVGGTFTALGGQTRNGIGQLNPDGTLDTAFNVGSSSAWVYALAIQVDGKVLVAGSFGSMGGQTHRNIARLYADGSVDETFTASVSNSVNCLSMQTDGKILLGGSFKGINGQTRMYIARLNADGSLDADFNPGANHYVYSLALQPDGMIVAGGRFTSLGDAGGAYLARLNADGAADTGFYPSPDNFVYALAVQPDGRIITGGRFTSLGGQSCNRIGRLNADGSLDTDFGPGADSMVYTVALQADGKILVGGSFTNLVGQARNRLGRLNADGTLDTTFDTRVSGYVYAIGLQPDGKVLAGGQFTNMGGMSRTNFARLNNTAPATQSLAIDGSTVTWLRSGTSPEVWRADLAVTTDGSEWTPAGDGLRIPGGWQFGGLSFPPKATIRARGFVTSGQYNGSAWFTESFAGYPVLTSQPLSRTNNANTLATFNVLALGSPLSYQWRKDDRDLNNGVNVAGATTAELVLSNVFGADAGQYSVVLSNAFGSITSAPAMLTVVDPLIARQPASHLANASQTITLEVGAVGSALNYQWRKNGTNLINATTSSLTLTNLHWIDRGAYEVIVSNRYGCLTSSVAQVTVNLAYPTAPGPGADGAVSALVEQPDGRILVGGTFNGLAGRTLNRLGRLNIDGTLDSTFAPAVQGDVFALALQTDAKLLVAGSFSRLNGQARHLFGRLNADGTLDDAYDYSAIDWVTCMLVQPDGRILLGGSIVRLGEVTNSFYSIARLNASGVPDVSFCPIISGYLRTMAMQTDGQMIVGGYLTGIGSYGLTNLGRIYADGSPDTNFTPAVEGGEVYALAVQADGKILVGGGFTSLCGQPREKLGRLNQDGTLDLSFNPLLEGDVPGSGSYNSPYVCTIGLQADGKILLGGRFTNLCGEARSCLGRLNADGTIDPTFNPWAEGWDALASGLALQANGNILVSGQFTSLAGTPATNFGCLNNTAAATQSLTRNGSTITWLRGGTSPEVYGTTFDYTTDGSVWTPLGYGARVAGGWQVNDIAAPENATVRARGFMSGGSNNSSSWYVETLLGKVITFGAQPVSVTNNAGVMASFNVIASGVAPLTYQWRKDGTNLEDGPNISGAHTPALAILSPFHRDQGRYSVVVSSGSNQATSLTATLTVLDPVMIRQPMSVAVNNGQTTNFTAIAVGTDLRYQWRKDGAAIPGATTKSLDLTYVAGAQAGVYDLVVANLFGSVTSAPAMLTVNLVNVDGWFNPSPDGSPLALALQTDGKILVGGEFTSLGGRAYLGRLAASGSVDDFSPLINGFAVSQLAVQEDSKILVRGYLFSINGQTVNGFGRLNPDGTLDLAFIPNPNESFYLVATLPGGKMLVSSSQNNLLRLDNDGSVDNSFNPVLPGQVFKAAMQPDGRIVVGGWFSSILRLNPDGSPDPTFRVSLAGSDPRVGDMVLQPDGRILISGGFTNLAGRSCTNVGRLYPDGALDLSFQPVSDTGIPALALQADGKIILSGSFTRCNGQVRNRLARLNADGTLDLTFNPDANEMVHCLALQPDGSLLVGGDFTKLGGNWRQHLGRLYNSIPATQTLSFDGTDILWQRGGSSPEIWLANFAISTNGTIWHDLGTGAPTQDGWRLAGMSAPMNSLIRARGDLVSGQGLVDQTITVRTDTPPKILATDGGLGFRTNHFGFNLRALPGQVVVIETSSDLVSWIPLVTNILSTNLLYFSDLATTNRGQRFYRAGSQ